MFSVAAISSLSADARLQIETPLRLTLLGTPGTYVVEYTHDVCQSAQWQPLRIVTLSDAPVVVYNCTNLDGNSTYFQVTPCSSCTNVPPNPDPEHLVWIPPGSFYMGSSTTEPDRFNWEGPQTLVTLPTGFWMSKYEVTQSEYTNVLGSNPSEFLGANLPVDYVAWEEATNYCAKLTEREAAAGRIPSGYFYRLPTEAEWEYACRAGTSTTFSYGTDPSYSAVANYAWSIENSGGTTHPVGQKLPNPWGLFDMHGNVSEWCLDYWDWNLAGGIRLDPLGPTTGSDRVIRGGDYGFSARYCRSANRYGSSNPLNCDGEFGPCANIGFRVVLSSTHPQQ